MLPNPWFPSDLVTFTEEIRNGKLTFLFNRLYKLKLMYSCVQLFNSVVLIYKAKGKERERKFKNILLSKEAFDKKFIIIFLILIFIFQGTLSELLSNKSLKIYKQLVVLNILYL